MSQKAFFINDSGDLVCCPECCQFPEMELLFSPVTGCQCAELEEQVATIAFDVVLLIDAGGPPGGGTLWDGTVSYAQGDYVYDAIGGTYYEAVQAVPGTPLPAPPIPLSDTNYWVPYTANDIDYVGYLKDSSSATCWPSNTPSGGFVSDPAAHPACTSGPWTQGVTGSFTSAKTFTAWYNQYTNCAAEDDRGFSVTITNTGADSLRVNGTSVAPGGSIGVAAAWAGYNTGDQSGFGSGTSIVVEKDYVGTGKWFTVSGIDLTGPYILALGAPSQYSLASAGTCVITIYSDDTCSTETDSATVNIDLLMSCLNGLGYSITATVASGTAAIDGVDFSGRSLFTSSGYASFDTPASNASTCADPLDTGIASGGTATIDLP